MQTLSIIGGLGALFCVRRGREKTDGEKVAEIRTHLFAREIVCTAVRRHNNARLEVTLEGGFWLGGR